VHILLPLIILIEGFISVSVEILTLRQLLPVAGSSVVVTSLVIGIFLLFLALGYQRGGRHHPHPERTLSSNFLIAAILIGTGLSYTFVTIFFYVAKVTFEQTILVSLIAYLLTITAPLIYILGQTVPITMNMFKQTTSVGKIGGNVLGISTLGSFLGAVLTTLFFMYFFGVAWTIFLNFMLLAGLTLILLKKSENKLLYLTIFAVAGWFVFQLNVSAERTHFVLTNNYGNYEIINNYNPQIQFGEKILRINDTNSSMVTSDNKGFKYIEVIKQILFTDMGLKNADILVLGAGGFSLTAESTNENRVTYVDIDPQLSSVVIPRFIPKYNGKLISDDGRHFIRSTNNTYHAIILDAFTGTLSIPSHLITTEFMQEIQNRLKPNGTFVVNVIANPFMQDHYSKRVDNTIRNVFHACVTFPHFYANKATNIIYVCQRNSAGNDKVVYSDNINNSSVDALQAHQRKSI
jgi:spermidine synthase